MLPCLLCVAPSLSPSSSTTVRGVASSDTTSCSTNRTQNAAHTDLSSSSPTPTSAPPRVKCDPFEQGGRPLSTEVALQPAAATLDPAWRYGEGKRLLVRSFEFVRTFERGEAAKR